MGKKSKSLVKTSKSVGRPKKYDIDTEKVYKLAKYNLTNKEISDIFGCPEETLRRNYGEYLTKGRGELIRRLRQAQYEVAVKHKNVSMLIWLGKQILGQAEKAEVQMNRPIEEVEYMEI